MSELAFPTQANKDDAEYEGQKKRRKGNGFQSLGLSKHVFGGVMRMGYKVPTPIQRKTLPLVLAGRDVVAMARTGVCASKAFHAILISICVRQQSCFYYALAVAGSGKTAAFLIPMLERLGSHSNIVSLITVY